MLTPGTTIGGYEILSSLGAGGMGEVYRARDPKLKRDVALKILPQPFTSDPDRLARFQREAEVLAALNHPNIAHVHGLEETGGVRALVMELVEGEDLAHRLARGPVPLDEALPIARQIAEALVAAHDHGIVHRDLKPANVRVRPDGTVKVLDFGLAKAGAAATTTVSAAGSHVPDSPTMTSPSLTLHGMLLGTAAYMSPEQAKGRPADKRSDIWAFGCVVYEMLTGTRAFPGDDVSDTLASVLKAGPVWTRLPIGTPPSIVRLLQRCLVKERKGRLADAADALLELDAADDPATPLSTSAVARASGPAWRERVLWMAAVLAGIAVATLIPLRQPTPESNEMRVDIVTPQSVMTQDPSIALSPDGTKLAFIADDARRAKLWLRSLDSTGARALNGTEEARLPFWSDDSRSIGFFTATHLKTIAVDTQAVSVLSAIVTGGGGSWNGDTVIYSPNSGFGPLFQISARGGTATSITKRDSDNVGAHRHPEFLPDGRHFVYFDSAARNIHVADLAGGADVTLTAADSGAILASGHLLFLRQGSLVAQPFDVAQRQLSGAAHVLVTQIAVDEAARRPVVSASRAGPLAYRTASSVARRQWLWVDRTGRELGTVGPLEAISQSNPNLSPDGTKIALQRGMDGNTDLWILDLARAAYTRLTTEPTIEAVPVWSPDGRRLAFNSSRGTGTTLEAQPASSSLFVMAADGSTPPKLVAASSTEPKWANDWSPDGSTLLYRALDTRLGTHDLWAAAVDGSQPTRLVGGPADERDAQFSPDGRWIAYQSDESGRPEIYIQRFPGPGGKERISTVGGTQVRWRRDGRELFYVTPDEEIASVGIKLPVAGGDPTIDTPRVLFATRMVPGGVAIPRQQYVVTADGERFLINSREEDRGNAAPITLLLNWKGGPHP